MSSSARNSFSAATPQLNSHLDSVHNVNFCRFKPAPAPAVPASMEEITTTMSMLDRSVYTAGATREPLLKLRQLLRMRNWPDGWHYSWQCARHELREHDLGRGGCCSWKGCEGWRAWAHLLALALGGQALAPGGQAAAGRPALLPPRLHHLPVWPQLARQRRRRVREHLPSVGTMLNRSRR